jgi:natural product biosynthesis luciferase-like monooxygenase protein
MNAIVNQSVADLFTHNTSVEAAPVVRKKPIVDFSYLFFSDVRTDVSDQQKYQFTRDLVEFADRSGFTAVYFPERHFYEFGSIFANNAVAAAYFAGLTKNVRLRTAAVTATLHHPVEVVENWAMVDILSNGRVDLGIGNGWNKADFILAPDNFADRTQLRNDMIPIIQKLWRGESMAFTGPDGEMFETTVYPRPRQKELNIWYVSNSIYGFQYAGKMGYNVFTMLSGTSLEELKVKIDAYRQAREEGGFDPQSGIVSLMMHTFVHPDLDWVQQQVATPFKAYIRSSLGPHMRSVGKTLSEDEMEKMVEYSYARYFQTGGIFGPLDECQKQINKAVGAGVNEIAFLQDFGVDYDAVLSSLKYLQQLVEQNNVVGVAANAK